MSTYELQALITLQDPGVRCFTVDKVSGEWQQIPRFDDKFRAKPIRKVVTRGDIDLARDFCLEFDGTGHYNAICRPADELLRIVAGIQDYDSYEEEQLLEQIKKTDDGRTAVKMCGYYDDAIGCIKRILDSDVLYSDQESESESSSDSDEDENIPVGDAREDVRRSPRLQSNGAKPDNGKGDTANEAQEDVRRSSRLKSNGAKSDNGKGDTASEDDESGDSVHLSSDDGESSDEPAAAAPASSRKRQSKQAAASPKKKTRHEQRQSQAKDEDKEGPGGYLDRPGQPVPSRGPYACLQDAIVVGAGIVDVDMASIYTDYTMAR
eukprot:COSAG06_NODE_11881_length_1452_cov_2.092387_2_plen_322_part_00